MQLVFVFDVLITVTVKEVDLMLAAMMIVSIFIFGPQFTETAFHPLVYRLGGRASTGVSPPLSCSHLYHRNRPRRHGDRYSRLLKSLVN